MPETLLRHLKQRYMGYYDIKDQPPFISFPLDIYAHFYQHNEKYFASKKINIWRLDHEEHCLVKSYDKLTDKDLDQMLAILKSCIENLVKPHPEHLKTLITGVLIVKTPLDPEFVNLITKFRHSKVFKFYLYGWSDIRLIVINSSSGQVLCNSAGREVKKFYEKLLVDTNTKMEEVVL